MEQKVLEGEGGIHLISLMNKSRLFVCDCVFFIVFVLLCLYIVFRFLCFDFYKFLDQIPHRTSCFLCTISPASKHKTTNIQFAFGWVSSTQSWILSKSAKLRYFSLTLTFLTRLFDQIFSAPTRALHVMMCCYFSFETTCNFFNFHSAQVHSQLPCLTISSKIME